MDIKSKKDFSAFTDYEPTEEELSKIKQEVSGTKQKDFSAFTDYDPEEEISQLEASLRGGAKGISYDLSDEFVGGIKAGLKTTFGDEKLKNILETYRSETAKERELNKKAEEAWPITFKTSEVAAGIAPIVATGGGAALGSIATKAFLPTLGKALVGGAKYGGLQGFGASEADLTQGDIEGVVGDALSGAKSGAIVSGGFSGLGNVAGKTLRKGSEVVKDVASHIKKGANEDKGGLYKTINAYIKTKENPDLPISGVTLLEKQREKMLELVKEIQPKLSKINGKLGQEIGDIVKKAKGDVDITNDLVTFIDKAKNTLKSTGKEDDIKNIEGLIRIAESGLKMKSISKPLTEEALEIARKERQRLIDDTQAKQNILSQKEINLSSPEINEETQRVIFKDPNAQKIYSTPIKGGTEDALKKAEAKKLEKETDLLRKEEITGEEQKYDFSKPEIEADTNRAIFYNKDTGITTGSPIVGGKDAAISAADLKRLKIEQDLLAKKQMKVEGTKAEFSEPEIDLANNRIKFQNLKTGDTHSIPIKSIDEKVVQQTIMTPAEIQTYKQNMSKQLGSFTDGMSNPLARELTNLYKDKVLKSLPDDLTREQYEIVNKQFHNFQTAIDTFSKGLNSADKVARLKAEQSLANLANNISVKDNLSTRTLFGELFKETSKHDPVWTKQMQNKIMNLSDDIDLNLTAMGNDPTQSQKLSQLFLGSVSKFGIKGAATLGRTVGKSSRKLKSGSELMKSTNERIKAATPETLKTIANKAQNTPFIKNFFTDLSERDQSKRSALLFSAMQNPELKRQILNSLGMNEEDSTEE